MRFCRNEWAAPAPTDAPKKAPQERVKKVALVEGSAYRGPVDTSNSEHCKKYLDAKIGVDTAENEPLEVWGEIFKIIQSCP